MRRADVLGTNVSTAPVRWALGTALVERSRAPGAVVGNDRTRTRLRRWRAAHDLGASGQLDRLLAAAGLDEAALSGLLGENPDQLAGRLTAPEWARRTAETLAQPAAHTGGAAAECAGRFAADRAALVSLLGNETGPLVGLTAAGDTHRRGRSVTVLRFASGARLIYKSRPVAVQVHFNELVTWLNRTVPDVDLATLRVLDRGAWGWVEHVDARELD